MAWKHKDFYKSPRFVFFVMTLCSLFLHVLVLWGGGGREEHDRLRERDLLRAERFEWELRNVYLREKVEGLSSGFPDYDLLEEEVRRVLHYGRSGDIVLREMELLR
jgi:hypothetical protein